MRVSLRQALFTTAAFVGINATSCALAVSVYPNQISPVSAVETHNRIMRLFFSVH